ncbi:hypothetical protein [Salinispira pacifica]|uniref:Uncharacterized protein n=1 Tax=Salinispira pacifica TaxID=1307761 RepID=V5WGR9_9SPIO|nr:hypothetical protein [Salinispira pacifica]AHC14988.1 hypothetical protein L21SP2_1601 [Salinispira pacifica]
MSTTSEQSSNGGGPGDEFIRQATEITHKHLQMVSEESCSLFQAMLSKLWLEEGILDEHEARSIPSELTAHLRKHFSLDQLQALCRFFLDFFSGGLSGQKEGQLSFTHLEFDGLKHFQLKFAHRLPEEDRSKLHELIAMLEKSGG